MKQELLNELLVRAGRYTAKYEKSAKEVRDKLFQWSEEELTHSEADHIIEQLTAEKFIDEERYVERYLADKLEMHKKGPWLIRQELLTKGIAEKLIDKAFSNVADSEWEEALRSYILPRFDRIKSRSKNKTDLYYKLKDAAFRRGFSHDLFSKVYDKSLHRLIEKCDELDEGME